jgi:hypothetical protein
MVSNVVSKTKLWNFYQNEIWAIKHPKYKFLKVVFLSFDICNENHTSVIAIVLCNNSVE